VPQCTIAGDANAPGADPGGSAQGIKTHHFDIRNTKIFWGGSTDPSPDLTPLVVFGARPPVTLSDGLDTRPCKILHPPLNLIALLQFAAY